MSYTDNPLADFDNWDREQQKQLERLPRCSECKKRIYGDHLYHFDDELICEDCLIKNHRKLTDYYVK